jgi:hypothetical protein
MTCPHCRDDARCKGFRHRDALTLLGAVRFRRHYYHCRHCGRGCCPLDETLGLGAADLTPAADEAVCLAGVQASFADTATKLLARLSGLRLSEATAQRTTEAAGRRVGAARAAGQTCPWPVKGVFFGDAGRLYPQRMRPIAQEGRQVTVRCLPSLFLGPDGCWARG